MGGVGKLVAFSGRTEPCTLICLPPLRTTETLKLTVPLRWMSIPANPSILKLLWRGGRCNCWASHYVISDVHAVQSSKAQACIILPLGAMTLTRHVINSTSSLRFDGTTYIKLPTDSLGFSGFGLGSTCNRVWWYLWYFLHFGGALQLLAVCPNFKQFYIRHFC